MSQKQIFMTGEGDQYFQRNRAHYVKDGDEPVPAPAQFYSACIKPGSKILEIGCCNGNHLHHLQSIVPCECFGIDPSASAIEDGRRRFPSLALAVGTSDALKFKSQDFDFVLFGFCLYLVDRELLPQTVAEADRVLKPNGFLGITDFDVAVPTIQPYKHAPGVFTYKLDYSRLFTAYPHYVLVNKISFSHHGDAFHADPRERLSATVLYKDPANAYACPQE
jgi:SAM-dependent methyltransferase